MKVDLQRICVVPRVSGVGGMVSFRDKLKKGLLSRGVEFCDNLADYPYQAVLVIGGTRKLFSLWRARSRGIPVVQRLDGINWLHRLPARKTGSRSNLFHYLRAEYGNALLSWIRAHLATQVVYQSDFARLWWEREKGLSPVPVSVIHNGVDLDFYSPKGLEKPPENFFRLLLVEGNIAGGYEHGLMIALELAQKIQMLMVDIDNKKVELMVVGRAAPQFQREMETLYTREATAENLSINWVGKVEASQIPSIDRGAHLFYSSDIHPACPNSVLEAFACGLPVIAFDTGALPELVSPRAGRLVAYGGDPWQLDPPDVDSLAQASLEVVSNLGEYRRGARSHAEANFGLDAMVDAYIRVLSGEEI